MRTPGTVLKRLYDRLESAAHCRRIVDLRVGLGYVGAMLDNGAAGIAAVLPDTTLRGCGIFKKAGMYAGACATDALDYLMESQNSLHCAIGLATANALIEPVGDTTEDLEATTYFNLEPGEKVAMVGLFAPLVERIRAAGVSLTVIEKNPERMEILSPDQKMRALQNCDVAIITATTLLNNTFEDTMDLLGTPRVVALMGPSTPLMPEIFHDMPVTQLGGAVIADSARVFQVISEGGGTPALRPYLRFVNLML
jgi:hypothetical protein